MPGLSGITGISAMPAIFGAGDYASKVLGYGPIAYWIQREGSGVIALDEVLAAQNGTYTGITWPDPQVDGPWGGTPSPYYDGANDYTNIWTTTFRDRFNGSEGTAHVWARFPVGGMAGVALRYMFILRASSQNRVQVGKENVANTLSFRYEAGDVDEYRAYNLAGVLFDEVWFSTTVTWSKSNDRVRYSVNGLLQEERNTLGNWAGLLSNTTTLVGAGNTVPQSVFDGWERDMIVFDRELAQPEVLDLATV